MYRPEDDDDLISQWWRHDGYEYQLLGIMYDKEDWWYVLGRGGKINKHTQLLSCVCTIEMYNFKKVKK